MCRVISNPFERFRDKRIEILQITESGPYTREWTAVLLGEVMADIQPYSGKLIMQGGTLQNTEYGLKSNSLLRLFTNESEHIKTGNYVRFDGKVYRINFAVTRQFGTEALLDEYNCQYKGA